MIAFQGKLKLRTILKLSINKLNLTNLAAINIMIIEFNRVTLKMREHLLFHIGIGRCFFVFLKGGEIVGNRKIVC